ncbi:hypothetical protein HK101_010981 [Irineochytrium annulatum]|nr:hypothetical protein HK101_010981 [Irineochytrium annulatum]
MAASTLRDVLPAWASPTSYRMRIVPNFAGNEHAVEGDFVYKGHVEISLQVAETTDKLMLNANELNVTKASIAVTHVKTETAQEATKIQHDREKERVTLTFGNAIPAGATAVLSFDFTGTHNDQMAGFYRSVYTDENGVKKHMVVTDFEPCNARQAFPCIDEPAVKATFDITLVVPLELMALSNMPVASEELVTENGQKLKAITFATTPLMSTYLVAMAVGDFGFVETTAKPRAPSTAKPITVRVYAVKGEEEKGRFGLEVAARCLEFFSEFFAEEYTLPKCDLIALPDFAGGAMENWGLVTYRATNLLFDEKRSSAATKQNIAYIIGHELAHQWFGNLVSCEWWSDLWLKEGFATFVGWLAVDHLFPEWDIWTQFITADHAAALGLDSLLSSHPIEVVVQSPSEIFEIFDAISYEKGASVIRMLNAALGGDTFMNGVRRYIQKFKYNSAVTTDLWNSLSEVSDMDVKSFMAPWTTKTGFPLVSVVSEKYDASKGTMSLKLRQSRFLRSGAPKPEDDQTVWWIPVVVATDQSPEGHKFIMSEREVEVTFPYTETERSFWKLNGGVSGFFRVRLEERHIAKLANVLRLNPTALSAKDRLNLLTDTFEMSVAGFGSFTGFLQLVQSLEKEEDYTVLKVIYEKLSEIKSSHYLESETILKAIDALIFNMFSPKVKRVGWDYPEGEPFLASKKRTIIINAACASGDETVASELTRRLRRFAAGDRSVLAPDLVLRACVNLLQHTSDPDADFALVVSIMKDRTLPDDQRKVALSSLGAVNSMTHINELLSSYFFDKDVVRVQDVYSLLYGVVNRNNQPTVVKPVVWDWIKQNLEKIYTLLKSSPMLFERVVLAFSNMHGLDLADEVEAWFKGEDAGSEEEKAKRVDMLKGAKRAISQGLEEMRSTTKWVIRERPQIRAWVEANM